MICIAPLVVLAALYLAQDSLILQPDFVLPSWNRLAADTGNTAVWQEQGRYLGKIHEPDRPAPGAAEPRGTVGTVILFHGNAGNVDHRLPLSRALTSRGLRTVLVEYPGFGNREGQATVNAILAASLDDFRLALERWPPPVYVFGESFGAAIAAQVIAHNPDKVAGAVLITPWDSLASVAKAKLFQLPLDVFLHHRLDSAEALAGYRGKLAIVAAEKDRVIPVGHARALARALPAAFYTEVPSANHNTWLSRFKPEEWDRLLDTIGARQ